jgi:hypothetical protein
MQDDCDPRASNPVRFLGRSLSLLPPPRVDNAARCSSPGRDGETSLELEPRWILAHYSVTAAQMRLGVG